MSDTTHANYRKNMKREYVLVPVDQGPGQISGKLLLDQGTMDEQELFSIGGIGRATLLTLKDIDAQLQSLVTAIDGTPNGIATHLHTLATAIGTQGHAVAAALTTMSSAVTEVQQATCAISKSVVVARAHNRQASGVGVPAFGRRRGQVPGGAAGMRTCGPLSINVASLFRSVRRTPS